MYEPRFSQGWQTSWNIGSFRIVADFDKDVAFGHTCLFRVSDVKRNYGVWLKFNVSLHMYVISEKEGRWEDIICITSRIHEDGQVINDFRFADNTDMTTRSPAGHPQEITDWVHYSSRKSFLHYTKILLIQKHEKLYYLFKY